MVEWMRHLTVTMRVALGFGFVIVVLVAQSGFGFLAAGESRNLMTSVVSETFLRYGAAVRLRDAIAMQDLHLRQIAVLIDAEQIRKEAAEVRRAGAEIDGAVATLGQSITSSREWPAVEEIARVSHATRKARDEVLRLSEAMQTDQANELFDRELAQASAKRRDMAGQLAEAQKLAMTTALETIVGLAEHSRRMTVISAVVGVMSACVAGLLLLRAITRPLNNAVAIAEQVAKGELAVRVESQARNEFGELLRKLQRMADRMRVTVGEIRQSSESVMLASHEIAVGNADLSARTERQASTLQMAVSSMQQMSEAVDHNATITRQADRLASLSAERAARGGRQVQDVVATMESISDSSARIGDIVGVIDGIAFQTNLLALNAAVEAARAGDHGRGFAVVAGEVRSLAQRAGTAAREIKQLIAANVSSVDAGTGLVRDACASIGDIVQSSEELKTVVARIAEATGAQADTARRINVAVSEIDQGLQQNASLAEQSTAAADSLKSQTEALNTAVRRFRLD